MPAPTVTITQPDPLVGMNDLPIVSFTFSEPVNGFTLADLSSPAGFFDQLNQVGGAGSATWTARLNPFPSTDLDDVFVRVNLAGVTSAADGTPGAGDFDSDPFDIDTVRPSLVSFTSTDLNFIAGDTATITVVFSEPVTLGPSPFAGPSLTFSNIQTSDNITYTATVTPAANQPGIGSSMGVFAGAAVDAAGNGNSPAVGPSYTVSTIRPTLTISFSDDQVSAGETVTVTFTFSVPVTGFDDNDLSVFGIAGSLTPVVPSFGGPMVWTSTFTPFADVTDLTNVIVVDMSTVQSIPNSNFGAGQVFSPNFAVDTLRPTVSVMLADDQLGIGETTAVTFTFSEAVTGFTNADVTVENGTLSAVSSGDGGVTWTATFTPTAAVNDATNVITVDRSGVTDGFGNAGSGSATSPNYVVDGARPTVTSFTLDDTVLNAGDDATVTVVFSEAVTGFTDADVTTPVGVLGAFSSGDGGVTWTATLAAPAGGVTDATNVLTLNLAGLADSAGNAGTGTSSTVNYAVDTARPTLTITLSDTRLAVGETSLVTFTFSEAVTGFTNADITVPSGSLSAVTSSNGGLTWTATYTPNAGLDLAGLQLSVDLTGVADAAGNTGTGAQASPNFLLDSTAPTATITISDSAITDGETPTVTVVFSEPVASFSLVTPNGSVGTFAVSNGAMTYAATYTPFEGVVDATNVISLVAGARDIAGNLLTGSPTSANYAVTTSAPDDGAPPPAPPPPPPPSPPAPRPPPTNEVVPLAGSENSDLIAGTAERNMVVGGLGTDSINGDAGDDTISGDEGADNLQGNTGLDSLSGGVGNDTMHGGQDTDMVQGGADNDWVFGDRGDDTVRGGQGDDMVFGGDGDDFLSGDRGDDTVAGGLGADTFHGFGGSGIDRITDFSFGEGDRVRLDPGTTFTAAQVGGDTVISLGGGGQMILAGVQLSSLADNWILVG